MRVIAAMLLLFAAMIAPVSAQDRQIEGPLTGLICDTAQQVERFVSIMNGGVGVGEALERVNAEVNDPKACVVETVFLQRGDMVKEMTGPDGKNYEVTKVTIVGVIVPPGVPVEIAPADFFALFLGKGVGI